MMAILRLQILFVAVTFALYFGMSLVHVVLFRGWLEHTEGISWFYLPASVRLLCTLLFGGAGAIGLLLASFCEGVLFHFPSAARAAVGALFSTAAPWAVYLWARRAWGLQASLKNLTARRLLGLCLAYSVSSPLLHHIYFMAMGQRDGLLQGFAAMFVGDLVGTLVVLYGMRAVALRRRARR